ncbi:MAG TPA: hypothetical protein VI997_08450 [Candidatus Thermoplasmatota archaeon]|nr:hypothetical protein [Candidatus Thermoplasmatota archaeon]
MSLVRWKRDAIRLAVMSLSVLAGGVLVLVGVANATLKARGHPAPLWTEILTVTLLGGLLVTWPVWRATQDMLRAKREVESARG